MIVLASEIEVILKDFGGSEIGEYGIMGVWMMLRRRSGQDCQ